MDERGALKVNEFLQVEGHQDIFAIGDCNDIDEPKMAYLAGLQGEHLVKQLANVSNDKTLAPYKLGNHYTILLIYVCTACRASMYTHTTFMVTPTRMMVATSMYACAP